MANPTPASIHQQQSGPIGQDGISGCLAFTLPNSLPPAQAQTTVDHWHTQLTQRLTQFQGRLDVLQTGVFWVFFPDDEPALALRRCLKALWPVLTKPMVIDGELVLIQLGLARGEHGDPYAPRQHTTADQRCVLPSDLAALLPPGVATRHLETNNGLVSLALPPLVAPPVAVSEQAAYSPEPIPQASQPEENNQPEPDTVDSHKASVAAMAGGTSDTVVSQTESTEDSPNPVSETQGTVPKPDNADHSHGVGNLFDIPVHQYDAPALASLPQPSELDEPESPEEPTPNPIALPTSPPTIPEVVSQRYSVALPQEPEAEALPVFSGLTGRATTSLGTPTLTTLSPSKEPYHRLAAAMGVAYNTPAYFDPLLPTPTPSHTYQQLPEALHQAVQAALQPTVNHPGQRKVTLVGPSGCGKSAWLTHGLLQQLIPDPQQPSVIWFAAQATDGVSDGQQPLSLWRDLLQRAVPIPPEGAESEQLKKWIQQSLDQVFAGETDPDYYHVFEHLLCVAELPSDVVVEDIPTANLLARFFQTMAAQMPIAIVLDDLHRADAASIELLCGVWEALPDEAPIAWVMSWDTQAGQPMGDLANALTDSVALSTSGLDEAAFEGLFQSGPFQGMSQALTSSLRQQLRQQTLSSNDPAQAGSLLYVSEVLTWLHAQQVLVVNEDTGTIQANPEIDPTTIELPADLDTIYHARLNWLTPEQQELLAWAATLGERFSLQLLAMCCGFAKAEFDQALQGLAAQQWVLTDFQHTAQFRHPSLLTFLRNQLAEAGPRHQQVAEQLATLAEQGVSVSTSQMAYHTQQPPQQRQAWLQTAAMAGQLGSLTGHSMALVQAGHALQQEATQYPDGHVPQSLIAEEMALKTRLAQANLTQQPALAAQYLPAVVDFHRHQGNQPALVESLGSLMVAFERIGHLQGALEVVDNCLEHVGNEPAAWVTLQAQRATILEQLGQLTAAKAILDEPVVVQHLQPGSSGNSVALNRLRDKVARVHGRLVWQLLQTNPTETIDAQMKTVSASAQVGLRIEAANTAVFMGQFPQAHGLLEHCLPQIEHQDQPERLLAQWGLVALRLYRFQHNRAEAEQLILPSLEQAQTACDYPTWVSINLEAARLSLAAGGEKSVIEAMDIAETMAKEAGERKLAQSALESWQVLADCMLALNQPQRAETIIRQALAVAEKPNIGHQLKHTALTIGLAQSLIAQEELQAAGDILQPLWPTLKDSPYRVLVKRGATVIASLYTALAKCQPSSDKRQEQEQLARTFTSIAES